MSARRKTRVRRAGGGARDTGRRDARKVGRDAQKAARPREPYNQIYRSVAPLVRALEGMRMLNARPASKLS